MPVSGHKKMNPSSFELIASLKGLVANNIFRLLATKPLVPQNQKGIRIRLVDLLDRPTLDRRYFVIPISTWIKWSKDYLTINITRVATTNRERK